MVASAFGFSVGDFIAGIELINTAAKALERAGGAQKQFQQAFLDVQILEDVLKRVQALQGTTGNALTIQQIQFCSHACHVPLEQFLVVCRRLRPYLEQNANQSPGLPTKALKRSLTKIKWAVTLEKEVATLKAKIGPQLSAINILLQLESLDHTASSAQISAETLLAVQQTAAELQHLELDLQTKMPTQSTMAHLLAKVDDLCTRQHSTALDSSQGQEQAMQVLFSRMQTQDEILRQLIVQTRPQAAQSRNARRDASEDLENKTVLQRNRAPTSLSQVLHAIHQHMTQVLFMLVCLVPAMQRILRALAAIARSPTLLLADNIKVEDALGRTLSLPYEHFRYWPVVQARLHAAFKGCPGEELVTRNKFHLINMSENGDRVITGEIWDKAILPGVRLAMSMLVRSRQRSLSPACPRCDLPRPSGSYRTWTTCVGCKLIYRVVKGLSTAHEPLVKTESTPPSADWYNAKLESLVSYVVPNSSDNDNAHTSEVVHFKRAHIWYARSRVRGEDSEVKEDVQALFQRPTNLKPEAEQVVKSSLGGKWPYLCNACGRRYEDPEDLKHHSMGMPCERKPYQCDFCGKSYRHSNALKYHLMHSPRCKLQSNSNVTEMQAPAGHAQEKPYQCDACSKRYKNVNGLKYHLMHSPSCNPQSDSDVRGTQGLAIREEGTRCRCGVCGERYRAPDGLKYHLSYGERCNPQSNSNVTEMQRLASHEQETLDQCDLNTGASGLEDHSMHNPPCQLQSNSEAKPRFNSKAKSLFNFNATETHGLANCAQDVNADGTSGVPMEMPGRLMFSAEDIMWTNEKEHMGDNEQGIKENPASGGQMNMTEHQSPPGGARWMPKKKMFGISKGGLSLASYIRDDIFMAGTSPFNWQSPSFRSSRDLPEWHTSNYMKDYVCCDIQLDSMAELLDHYEQFHASRSTETDRTYDQTSKHFPNDPPRLNALNNGNTMQRHEEKHRGQPIQSIGKRQEQQHPSREPPKTDEPESLHGAKWTKIDRRLVNPQALAEAGERFEERDGYVLVLRSLTKAKVQQLANRTREIRNAGLDG